MKLAARDDRQLGLELTETPRKKRAGVLLSFHPQHQPIPVPEVLEREKKAGRQDAELLDFIRAHWPSDGFTPSEVHARYRGRMDLLGRRAPLLTSIRRSLTNATKRGVLRHWPQERRPGPHGVPESCWSLSLFEISGGHAR